MTSDHTFISPAVAQLRPSDGACSLRSLTAVVVRSPDLVPVVERFRGAMEDLIGIALPAPECDGRERDRALTVELDAELESDRTTLGVRADGSPLDVEAYRLIITANAVSVRAHTLEGAHRALTTLLQAVVLGDGSIACVTIDDAPELAWRGLSLDVVRTFVPLREVKRIIDLLSLYKLNVLHLHLTDNEGWRLQIESWPRLTEVSSQRAVGDRSGGYYTQVEYRDLVDYALDRFVTVIPEIDVPGHSRAALEAYPELGLVGERATNLAVGSDVVWSFVTDVLQEVASLSPAPFIHIGGDESFGMDDAAHARFITRTTAFVRQLGKRVVGWQEISRAAVGPDEVVQYWIDFAGALREGLIGSAPEDSLPRELVQLVEHFDKALGDVDRMAERRTPVLLSPNGHAYLDRPHGDPSLVPDQDVRRTKVGLPLYPAKTLEELLDWNPWTAVPGIDPAAIAGVEAALWGETVETIEDLELLLLPRLVGIAEVAWRSSEPTVWAHHRRVLAAHAELWRRSGWSWWHADSVDWFEPGA